MYIVWGDNCECFWYQSAFILLWTNVILKVLASIYGNHINLRINFCLYLALTSKLSNYSLKFKIEMTLLSILFLFSPLSTLVSRSNLTSSSKLFYTKLSLLPSLSSEIWLLLLLFSILIAIYIHSELVQVEGWANVFSIVFCVVLARNIIAKKLTGISRIIK